MYDINCSVEQYGAILGDHSRAKRLVSARGAWTRVKALGSLGERYDTYMCYKIIITKRSKSNYTKLNLIRNRYYKNCGKSKG